MLNTDPPDQCERRRSGVICVHDTTPPLAHDGDNNLLNDANVASVEEGMYNKGN